MHIITFPSIIHQQNDTNGYLSGAVSLVIDGNLNAVPDKRGPGMALLGAPIFKVFRSNSAIPMKILLHLLAFGSVLLTYGIVLELLKNHWAALLAGVLVAIRPDILVYSDELLSEVPTLFFTSLFAFFAIRFFSRGQVKWLYLAALSGSFLTLIRTENRLQIILLFLFVAMMIFQSFWRGEKSEGIRIAKHGLICLLISLIPIFAWSYHNLQTRGFFGLSNYTYTQIYGGVITASYTVDQNPPIVNLKSPAVEKIQEATKAFLEVGKGRYPGIVSDDYRVGIYGRYDRYAVSRFYELSEKEFSALFTQAAIDSIKARPLAYLELLFKKLQRALLPQTIKINGFSGFRGSIEPYFRKYQPPQQASFPILTNLEQKIYDLYGQFKSEIRLWRYFSVFSIFLCLLYKPSPKWWFLAASTFTSAIFPIILGLPHPRYTLYGASLFCCVGVAGLWWLGQYLPKGLAQMRKLYVKNRN